MRRPNASITVHCMTYDPCGTNAVNVVDVAPLRSVHAWGGLAVSMQDQAIDAGVPNMTTAAAMKPKNIMEATMLQCCHCKAIPPDA